MKICFVITAEVFDLCDKRREPRKKRFEYEGPEKHKEVNNNIKKCTKKAKENWIREQCSETEGNLRNNNSKRAHQFVKKLTFVKHGKFTTVQDRSGNCLTEEREILNRWTYRILYSAVQSQGNGDHQYWTVPRHTYRMNTPSFAKKWRLQYNY